WVSYRSSRSFYGSILPLKLVYFSGYRRGNMEGSVFTYFFAIGSGLALGVGWVIALGFWMFNRSKRKGEKKHGISSVVRK
ncbi:hypothetical protein ABH897_005577, partial [Paenibacillus sp. RC73]|uniref:hypothetical protein n=1 Tax=Paenibacillus sp. RC73 TaxID=3156250 RepID=UPI0038364F3D